MGWMNGLYIFPILFLFFYFVFPTIINLLIRVLLKIFRAVMVYNPKLHSVVPEGIYKEYVLKEDEYDAVIVGAGPAGSSAAYYCSEAGMKVTMIEKNKFPHYKACGNVVNSNGIKILEEMGIFEKLKEQGKVRFLDNATLVSPSGLTYTGSTTGVVGEPLSATIPRTDLDEALARRAEESGAKLIEGVEVLEVTFEKEFGMWSISCNNNESYKGRVLILCDGAESKFGTRLGNVNKPHTGVCSITNISDNNKDPGLDVIVTYPPYTLPAICSMIRQPDNSYNLCYYLVPCGDEEIEGQSRDGLVGQTLETDLVPLTRYAIYKDPFISPYISDTACITPITTRATRSASHGVQYCYGEHLLICGDAAGFGDCLSGQGIHTALQSGREAALTMIEMYDEGDYSERSTRQYEDRCFSSFFFDSEISKASAEAIMGNPPAMDAVVEMIQEGGNKMFAYWARLMTMHTSKESALYSEFGYTFVKKMAFLYLKQKPLGRFFFKYYNYRGCFNGPYVKVKKQAEQTT